MDGGRKLIFYQFLNIQKEENRLPNRRRGDSGLCRGRTSTNLEVRPLIFSLTFTDVRGTIWTLKKSCNLKIIYPLFFKNKKQRRSLL